MREAGRGRLPREDQPRSPMAQQIEKVGVLGAGLMGHGIARAAEKGKMDETEAGEVRARIQGTVHYRDLADCDLVIEAITESLPLKLEMWREVDEIVKPGAVFATNTSSLAVIDQAAATSRPQQ